MTEANYSNGDYYHYAYDAVGNRETQQKSILSSVTNDTYVYDDANRIATINGVPYLYDDNGNLLNDGVTAYTYDSANRLKTLSKPGSNVTYAYNGLGDRLRETVNGTPTTFTMDLNAGLTQVLSDGTNTYIYGNGRIAQVNGNGTEHFLGDALGSVRQLTNASGAITYTKAYDPYGVVSSATGSSQSAYGYTNEYTSQGLVYLRARHYVPGMGRFLTQDMWDGSNKRPLSLNKYVYTESNPVNYTDPYGLCIQNGWNDPPGELFSEANCNMLEKIYLDASSGYSYKNLQQMEDWYNRLADATDQDGNKQAAANLRHFLNGNGTPLRLSGNFMQDDIWGWDYVQKKTDKLVLWYVRSKIPTLVTCQVTDIGSAGFARQITVFDNPEVFFNQPSSDVAGSLGNFRLDVVITGTLHKLSGWSSKTSTNLNLHLTVLDYYNWEPGKSAIVQVKGKKYEVPDDWGVVLATRGYGANYLVRGDLDVSFTQDVKSLWFGISPGAQPPDDWYSSSCIGINFDSPAYSPGECAPEVP